MAGRPNWEKRLGGIKVATWCDPFDRNGAMLTKFTAQFQKSYKAKDGTWATTDRLDLFKDWPRLRWIMDCAYAWACEQLGQAKENGAKEGE